MNAIERAEQELQFELAFNEAAKEGYFEYDAALVAVNKIPNNEECELLCAIRTDLSNLIRNWDPTVPVSRRFKSIYDIGRLMDSHGGLGLMMYFMFTLRRRFANLDAPDKYAAHSVLEIVANTWDGVGKFKA